MRGRLNLVPILAFSLASLAAPAAFAANAQPSSNTCFWTRDWQAWSSPSPKVLYFKIGVAEILRLDLEIGSNQLKYPDMHLVNRNHQNTYVCDPKQLDLLLSDQHGLIKVPLFVKTITRLTPEEAAAIPRQYWP